MDKKVLIQDLADGLVLRRGLPKKDADVFVRSVFEIIGEYLQTDKIVKVKGLGTFKLVTVDSRESVDVNTGERIVIKEYTKINFTPDPVLRDAVNKPFAQFETVVLYEGTDIADMERMDIPDLSEDHEAENISDVNEELWTNKAMIFNNITQIKINGFLDSLKKMKIARPLSAVVTETTIDWTLNKLVYNLIQERKAIQSGTTLNH